MTQIAKKPSWLRKKIFYSNTKNELQQLLKKNNLHTVCEEARCPNRSECYHQKTATFLILGKICTRNCLFCSVESSFSNNSLKEMALDPDEGQKISKLIKELELRYVVITSVTRDDLKDGGASQFAFTIQEIRTNNKNTKIEVLTPDFLGNPEAIQRVVNEKPDVYNHNLETVERLTAKVRKQSSYTRSLSLLDQVKKINPNIISKSGILVGLGETDRELEQLFQDLSDAGCDILTIGQYLQPGRNNIPVQEYVEEKKFDHFKEIALQCGIPLIHSAPFVRSSYKAYESYIEIKNIYNSKNLRV